MSTLQTMTEGERNLILAYRASDERGKRSIMEHAKSTAEDWPAPRPRPLLALVPIPESPQLRGEG